MKKNTDRKNTPLFHTKRRYIFEKVFCLAAALCLAASFSGCSEPVGKSERSFFAMDTLINITVYGSGAKAALDGCENKIVEIESKLSTELSGSEVYKLNTSGGASFPVSPETAEIIKTAVLVSEKSGGAFDITVYPIVKAWGFTGGGYRVPSTAELAELLKSVSYKNIKTQENNISLENGAQIDLGGIAKGYASDELREIFKDNGVESAIVSLGGNVLAHGSRPDGSVWRVGISKPDASTDIAAVLEVSDICVVTSGGYQRFFEENGEIYRHIIDPKTGRPVVTNLLSVTVVCENGALADALSTALFVLGEEKALEYFEAYGGFEAVLITADNRLICTAGLKESLTEPDKAYMVEYH